MNQILKTKYERLDEILKNLQSVAVAFSGGVDSALLLKMAKDALPGKAVAFTARSETYPESELEGALRVAKLIGVTCIVIETSELGIECFSDNPPDRCYYCKKELFTRIRQEAQKRELQHVIDGANADDVSDYRPGSRAGAEVGVRSPLREAGLTKKDIRLLSKELALPTWNKPAYACLASRFPYGEKITENKLKAVADAEELLRRLGFSNFRVRHHGTIARIEVPKNEIQNAVKEEIRDKITTGLKQLGFTYVTIDLEGYRTGSMNEPLSKKQKE